jgi:serine protease Do
MNIKIISIWIIFFSLLSGFFWSYIFSQVSEKKWNFQNIQQITKNVSITQLQSEITDIVKDVSPSVVNIIISKELTIYKNDPFNFFRQPVWSIQRKVWWGSWFFITKDGIILTNKHVVSDPNAQYTVILNNWEEFTAQVLYKDSSKDLAVLSINTDKQFTPLNFIKSYTWSQSDLKIGQFAIASGNVFSELNNSISLGVISWINRAIEPWNEKYTWLIQTDASINSGNSWGPLINLNGDVMWINTYVLSYQSGVSFAIPLSESDIKDLLKNIK